MGPPLILPLIILPQVVPASLAEVAEFQYLEDFHDALVGSMEMILETPLSALSLCHVITLQSLLGHQTETQSHLLFLEVSR